MARALFAPLGMAAALAPSAAAADAAPFKCGHIGGEFVFGQETNVNSLD